MASATAKLRPLQRLFENSFVESPSGRDYVKTRSLESPLRELGDYSSAAYKRTDSTFLNPPCGSWGKFKIQPTKHALDSTEITD